MEDSGKPVMCLALRPVVKPVISSTEAQLAVGSISGNTKVPHASMEADRNLGKQMEGWTSRWLS